MVMFFSWSDEMLLVVLLVMRRLFMRREMRVKVVRCEGGLAEGCSRVVSKV